MKQSRDGERDAPPQVERYITGEGGAEDVAADRVSARVEANKRFEIRWTRRSNVKQRTEARRYPSIPRCYHDHILVELAQHARGNVEYGDLLHYPLYPRTRRNDHLMRLSPGPSTRCFRQVVRYALPRGE